MVLAPGAVINSRRAGGSTHGSRLGYPLLGGFIIPQLAHPCSLPLIIVSGLWSSSFAFGGYLFAAGCKYLNGISVDTLNIDKACAAVSKYLGICVSINTQLVHSSRFLFRYAPLVASWEPRVPAVIVVWYKICPLRRQHGCRHSVSSVTRWAPPAQVKIKKDIKQHTPNVPASVDKTKHQTWNRNCVPNEVRVYVGLLANMLVMREGSDFYGFIGKRKPSEFTPAALNEAY